MKKKRGYHGCGIVHSIHHGSRPLLVVAGSASYETGATSSEFWDFTLAGSTWQLCSKSCSMLNNNVNFGFSILKKIINMPHQNLVNILGGHTSFKLIYGCHICVKIAIYVVKTTFSILLCTFK